MENAGRSMMAVAIALLLLLGLVLAGLWLLRAWREPRVVALEAYREDRRGASVTFAALPGCSRVYSVEVEEKAESVTVLVRRTPTTLLLPCAAVAIDKADIPVEVGDRVVYDGGCLEAGRPRQQCQLTEK